MTDTDDNGDGIEVVSKYKVAGVDSQGRTLTMDLPLHPLWHYYEVHTYVTVYCHVHTVWYVVHRSHSGTDPTMRPNF